MLRTLPVLAACGALAVACGGVPTQPTSARPARIARTRFMAFGDSLTTGEITAPIAAPGPISKMVVVPAASYPTQLNAQLAARYPAQASSIRVTNAGFGAETVLAGALRFGSAFDDCEPDVVLIMEGVNGLGAVGPDVSTVLVRDMTNLAQARNARVFIGSMIPTIAGRQRSQNADQLEAYNARLRQMSVEEGVVFVDLYTAMLPVSETLIGVDGLHPTEAGYRRIAELFFEAITNALEEP